MLYFPKGRK
jgi:hypothetical protein